MQKQSFFRQTAWRNLRRGGQHSLVAILCIFFGVASLVALNTLSISLKKAFVVAPPLLLGGDISGGREGAEFIEAEDLAWLEAQEAQGEITASTLIAYSRNIVFRSEADPVWHYPGAGFGVDTQTYPLAGSIRLQGRHDVQPLTLLEDDQSMLVSLDIAERYKIQPGMTLTISDLNYGIPLQLRVAGILDDTVNHQGDKVFYSLEVASRLVGGRPAYNTLLVNTPKPGAFLEKMNANGWWGLTATEAANSSKASEETLIFLLNGAGILALLIGGIGIGNTMQVLLNRRQREIATWKLLGYQNSDIRLLFALEAGLIGLLGSLPGAVVGIALSWGMTGIFARTSTMLVRWQAQPLMAVAAVLLGVFVSVIFSLWAILRVDHVSPASLLRQDPGSGKAQRLLSGLSGTLVVGIPFALVSMLIMSGLIKGMIALLLAGIGLGFLSLLVAVGLGAVGALLPVQAQPLLSLPKRNLVKNGLTPILAGVALLIGVVTIFFTLVTINNSTALNVNDQANWQGQNLMLVAPASHEAALMQALEDVKTEETTLMLTRMVKSIKLAGNPIFNMRADQLLGFDGPGKYALVGPALGSQPGVYTSDYLKLPVGSELQINFQDGSQVLVPVIGSYSSLPNETMAISGVLMSADQLRAIAKPDFVQLSLSVSPQDLAALTRIEGPLAQIATPVNLIERAARFTQAYRNFFVLALVVAGACFAAGLLLIANSVSLSVLNRRYQIGVQKSMGYSQAQVLGTLMVEYLIIAGVAFLIGLTAILGVSLLARLTYGSLAALFSPTPVSILLVALCTFGLTALTVLAAAWKPIQVSPMVVLGERQ